MTCKNAERLLTRRKFEIVMGTKIVFTVLAVDVVVFFKRWQNLITAVQFALKWKKGLTTPC